MYQRKALVCINYLIGRVVFTTLLILFFNGISLAQIPILMEGFPHFLDPAPWSQFIGDGGPVVADIDGDGKSEIITSNAYRGVNVILWNGRNKNGWPQAVNEALTLPPAVGDMDGDGKFEIVIFTYNCKGAYPYYCYSKIYAWHDNGVLINGFPKEIKPTLVPPVLYDMDNDGKVEIIYMTRDNVYPLKNEAQLHILKSNGEYLPGWPRNLIGRDFYAYPAVGDIDGDVEPEIVCGAYTQPSIWRIDTSVIIAFKKDGSIMPGFPFNLPTVNGIDSARYVPKQGFTLADLDGDSKLEILIGCTYWYKQYYYSKAYIIKWDGTLFRGWPQDALGWNPMQKMLPIPLYKEGPIYIVFLTESVVQIFEKNGNLIYSYSLTDASDMMSLGELDTLNQEYEYIPDDSVLDSLINDVWHSSFEMYYLSSTQLPWSPLGPIFGWGFGQYPSFGDLDGDGFAELVIFCTLGRHYNTLENRTVTYAYKLPGIEFNEENFPWPLYQHDRWRTGQYGFKPFDRQTGIKLNDRLPNENKLYLNYPNPFNALTKIRYDISKKTLLKLTIYNMLGQIVQTLIDHYVMPGYYEIIWDARKYPSGVYIAKLETEGYIGVQKLLLMK